MTPAELDRRVARAIQAIEAHVRSGGGLPPSWVRYCQGLLVRNALLRVAPDSDSAQVLYVVMGRLGLVVAE